MSVLSWLSRCTATLTKTSSLAPVTQVYLNQHQTRNLWADFRMKKDARRRNSVKELGHQKTRFWAIKRAKILPAELREVATEECEAMPRDAGYYRIVDRCCLTSKPRGNVVRWRLSRMVFRHLADYNKLSGVQRALW